MKKRVLFIVNPKSGKGAIRNQLLDIIDVFTKADFDLTIYISQAAQDAREKARKKAGEYDLIVCSGGDGTLDEVMSGIMESGEACAVGYIPCGSTNDFAKSLELPTSMAAAAKQITEWNEFPCDIGSFNEDYFVYIAAFGLFTDVSYDTSQDMKNILGHLAYILQGITKLMDIKSYPMVIDADDMHIEGDFIYGMVTNSTSVGGFRNITGKNVQLDDGVFEVTLVKTPSSIIDLNEIIQAAISGKPDDKNFYQFRSKKISFQSPEELPWTLDGEYGGEHKEVLIKNEQQAINILV